MELDLATSIGPFQEVDELPPKHAAQDLSWEEELFALASASFTMDPTGFIQCDTTSAYHAVQVWMRSEFLAPGMEHGQDSDLGSEMLRIGGQFLERFRGGTKQDIIDNAFILQGNRANLFGQRKHDVEIWSRKKLCCTGLSPLCGGHGLAFWAVAITAGVVGVSLVPTVLALFDVTAQGLCPTDRDCKRPNEGKVADNGTFVLEDWLFGDALKSMIYAFSVNGDEIMHHRFSANMHNTGLSPSGHYSVAQLAHSDSRDGGCLAFLDLVERKILWQQEPQPGWANSYRFDDGAKRLGLVYPNRGVYEYGYDGEFADSNRWEEDRVTFASGFELLHIVQEKLGEIPKDGLKLANSDYLLQLLNTALTKGVDKDPKYLARTYRTMGEIHEAIGNRESAIANYEIATGINPKVGVKLRLKRLKEQK